MVMIIATDRVMVLVVIVAVATGIVLEYCVYAEEIGTGRVNNRRGMLR